MQNLSHPLSLTLVTDRWMSGGGGGVHVWAKAVA